MKNRNIILLYSFIFLTIGICFAEPENGETYIIQSALGNNNRFLQVQGANPNRGARLNIQKLTNGSEQYFTLISAGEDFFYIRSHTQNNRAIQIANSHRGNNGTVNLEDIQNQDKLKWRFIKVSDEENEKYYYIRSRLGTYLTINNGNSAVKTFVESSSLENNDAFKWKLNNIKESFVFTREFQIDPIRNLCPTRLMKGDREFSSNGPNVTGRVFLIHDNSSVYALIKFRAVETKSDWSEVQGEWIRNIFSNSKWRINKILSDNNKTGYIKRITSTSRRPGLNPGDAFHINSCVSRMVITGDTGGDDISSDNDCNDDTGIRSIEFKPLELELTFLSQ